MPSGWFLSSLSLFLSSCMGYWFPFSFSPLAWVIGSPSCLFSHTCFPTPLGSFPLTDSIYSLRTALVPPAFYEMLQFPSANRTGHTNPSKLCPPLKGKAQTLESDKSEIKSQGPSLTWSSTVKLLNRPHLQNEGSNAHYFWGLLGLRACVQSCFSRVPLFVTYGP